MTNEADPRALYLDLLKRSLMNQTYLDLDVRVRYLRACLGGAAEFDLTVLHSPSPRLDEDLAELANAYEIGWPPGHDLSRLGYPHTMIGKKRLDNLQTCFERLHADGVPGDLVECGVWRGGAAVFLRGLLAAYGVRDRTVWAADSFEGLPPPSHPADQGFELSKQTCPMLAVDLATVRRVFTAYGLLDEQVRFVEGWFKDTLHRAPIEQIALLRLDGDLYESTADALHALYDRVASGGYVIVDDYAVPPCRSAVMDYRAARGITDTIEVIDFTGVFWRKS